MLTSQQETEINPQQPDLERTTHEGPPLHELPGATQPSPAPEFNPASGEGIAQHMEEVQAVADTQAEIEERTMDEAEFFARARIKGDAKFYSSSLTILFAGVTHVLSQHVDLIIRGKPMMQRLIATCEHYGLAPTHLELEEIDASQIVSGSHENVIGAITLQSSDRVLTQPMDR